MKHALIVALCCSLSACQSNSSAREDSPAAPSAPSIAQAPDRMAWWREARFGMFIHWGLYAVPAGAWNGATNHAEWIMTTAQIPVERYEQFTAEFNPVHFDADAWARMAADAGMKYVVITSKHHDGFALYDSDVSDYDVMATPFKRDVMAELSSAVRAQGLSMCWYHSIMDWHHPDYLPRRGWEKRPSAGADFERFRKYLSAQVTELLTKYGPIGVMWFDGEWESTWTQAYGKELYLLCRALQPHVIVNNRVSTGRAGMAGMTKEGEFPGDFGTPEQEIPAVGLPGVDWETCMTMNEHWGFNAADTQWKSSEDLIRKLCDIASKGGNFLLNVGPRADGTFPPEAVERLADIGRWMEVNGESIHGTQASPFEALTFGRCTQRMDDAVNSTKSTVYLHVFDWPADGQLNLEGLGNAVIGARLLADPARKVAVTSRDGRVALQVGATAPDPIASVVAVELVGAPIVFKAPKIATKAPRFLKTTRVEVIAGSDGLEARYTLDGSEPTSRSALASGPIEIADSCTLKARSFFQGRSVGATSSLALEKVRARAEAAVAPANAGLIRERFVGDFDKLPNFADLQPTASDVVAQIQLPDGPREERVAYVYRGSLHIARDDMYTFHLTSDDGSRLWIDDNLIVDNDGLHGAVELAGSDALAAGWHRIRVEWFNKSGGAELALTMHSADGTRSRLAATDLRH